ncbi:ATP-binding protein [Flavobacterium ponti]|uniref:histidine kinase n=1 Tax=Flavobacterium ponti TaxID=665133 RepID=A0ABV9P266_9FLAO
MNNYESDEFQELKLKGHTSYINGNYDSSYVYFNKAQTIGTSKPVEEQIYVSLFLSYIYNIQSDFNGLEEEVTKALALSNETKYNSHLYNFLGIAYEEKHDFNAAIENYDLASKYSSSELEKLIIQNNIAVIQLEQKEYKKAIQTLTSLLKYDTLVHAKKEYAKIIDNLGYAYFKNGNSLKAKSLLQESYKIRDSLDDDFEKIASLIHLSNFNLKDNPSLSQEFAKKALKSATIVNSADDKLEALDLLIKNPINKEVFKNFEHYSTINDSLNKARQTAKNQFSKIKYDSKIAIEKSEKLKIQKDQITYLFLGFGAITILVFFLIRSKNKRKLQKSAYDTETRISKRLHDELANDVFNTMTFIETQDLQPSKNKENVLQDLDSIYNKARSISKQNSEVKTGKDFRNSLNQLLMSYNSKQTNIIVKGSSLIDWEKVKVTKQIEVHRILTELLVNMKKHSQANLVLINFETLEKTIKIKYSDNGKGFEKEKIIKNGLQNVENRIHAINGSITFDSETNKGLKINIEFPK